MEQKSWRVWVETPEAEIMGKLRSKRISLGGEGDRGCESKMCGFPQRVLGGGA